MGKLTFQIFNCKPELPLMNLHLQQWQYDCLNLDFLASPTARRNVNKFTLSTIFAEKKRAKGYVVASSLQTLSLDIGRLHISLKIKTVLLIITSRFALIRFKTDFKGQKVSTKF